jgi:hypothetical protein
VLREILKRALTNGSDPADRKQPALDPDRLGASRPRPRPAGDRLSRAATPPGRRRSRRRPSPVRQEERVQVVPEHQHRPHAWDPHHRQDAGRDERPQAPGRHAGVVRGEPDRQAPGPIHLWQRRGKVGVNRRIWRGCCRGRGRPRGVGGGGGCIRGRGGQPEREIERVGLTGQYHSPRVTRTGRERVALAPYRGARVRLARRGTGWNAVRLGATQCDPSPTTV